MKLLLIAVLSVFACSARAQTNVPVDAALSNVMASVTELQNEIKAAKSNIQAVSTIQTVVFSNGIPIATNSAAAPAITTDKINVWSNSAIEILGTLGGLIAAIAAFARILRKVIPDKAQVNQAGVLLANLSGEINPSVAKLAAVAAAPAAPVPTTPPAPAAALPKV